MATKKVVKEDIVDGDNQEIDQTPVEVIDTQEVVAPEKKLAKAGKRSAKAIAEVEAVEAKEERKARHAEDEAEEAARPVQHKNATRTKLERSGKKLREVAKLIEKEKEYTLIEALDLVVKTSVTKFDSSVEVHVNLDVDPRQADQNIRDNIMLPAGTGKVVRVAVFADADLHAGAKKAGADIIGAEDFLQQLDKELINFDRVDLETYMVKKV